jgi:amino acid permease
VWLDVRHVLQTLGHLYLFLSAVACLLFAQVGLLAGSLGLALLVEDLGLIFGFVGATGATMISFILPGISYYKMHAPMEEGPAWKRTGALMLCGLGCVVMPVCLIFLFL